MQPSDCSICAAISSQVPPGAYVPSPATIYVLFANGQHNGFCVTHYGSAGAMFDTAIMCADIVIDNGVVSLQDPTILKQN